MKNKLRPIASILGLSFVALATLASCSNSDDGGSAAETTNQGKFLIAATQGDATYFLTAEDLENGSTSIVGNGIEVVNSFTHLVNGNNAITALAYRQGDPGIGISFHLDANGNLAKLSNEFQLTSGYNTVGLFDQSIAAGRTATLASGNQGLTMYFVNQNTGVVTSKDFESTTVLGHGEVTPTFAGIVDRGNGEFLSAYTKQANNVDSVWVAAFDANLI